MTKILFLGTGTSQGVPIIGCHCKVCCSIDKKDKRLRSSVAIEEGGVTFIIDTGPDFRYQMLRAKIESIDAILFTHSHKDHTGGLDDVRAYNYILGRGIDIYAEEYCMKDIRNDYHYAFAKERYPGVPEVIPNIIDDEPFLIKGVKIVPVRGWHHKMPVMGYRIGDVVYLTDMNRIEDSEIEKIKGCKILIINALRHEEHLSHFTLPKAIEVSRMVGAENTYFTHISHQLGLHADVSVTLPDNMFLAYDGLILEHS